MSDSIDFNGAAEVDSVDMGMAEDEVSRAWIGKLPVSGSEQVRIPDDDASQEERDAFWSRLGRPTNPDEYEFSPGESATGYDTELADWFREAAHAVNMPVEMAQALHDRFLEARTQQTLDNWHDAQARGQETEALLSREWGSAYSANLELAQRAVAEMGGNELKEALEVSGMRDHPALIRAFAGIGRRLYANGRVSAENLPTVDSVGEQPTPRQPTTKASAQREIMRLRSDEKFMAAYGDRSHPSHEIAQAEMDALYAAAYPSDRRAY